MSNLTKIASSFKGDIRYGFAYGSGVFKQKSYKATDKPMLDFMFVVDDVKAWHQKNISQFPKHYPWMFRLAGAPTVTYLQEHLPGANVWFNINVDVDDQKLKYGCVSTEAFLRDLITWDTLYLAGRLHKPVKVVRQEFKDDATITNAMNYNYAQAVNVASLLVHDYDFTPLDLMYKIAGLSYSGDFRMLIGENPDKVKNIVDGSEDAFFDLYRPFFQNLIDRGKMTIHSGTTLDVSTRLSMDDTPAYRGEIVGDLPSNMLLNVTRLLEKKHKKLSLDDRPSELKIPVNDFERDEIAWWVSVLDPPKAELATAAAKSLQRIVAYPAFFQSVKGILSGGPIKAIEYSIPKLKKKWFNSSSQ